MRGERVTHTFGKTQEGTATRNKEEMQGKEKQTDIGVGGK